MKFWHCSLTLAVAVAAAMTTSNVFVDARLGEEAARIPNLGSAEQHRELGACLPGGMGMCETDSDCCTDNVCEEKLRMCVCPSECASSDSWYDCECPPSDRVHDRELGGDDKSSSCEPAGYNSPCQEHSDCCTDNMCEMGICVCPSDCTLTNSGYDCDCSS